MRLCPPAPLCLAAALLLSTAPAAHATFRPAAVSACAAADGHAFPLTSRIHGGPGAYEAGGGYGTWYLDLTNTTERTCAGIHPVVVLVDAKRALKPVQPRLEFYAPQKEADTDSGAGLGTGGGPRPVRFEATDEDELVGVFGDGTDGFPGFTVGPRKTVTVKVRLALTSDAVPNQVTANAAVVQRRGDDGDWVGQSNDYRFAVTAEPTPAASASAGAGQSRLPFADELARSGFGLSPAATGATVALLLAGAVLLLGRKRR